MPDVQGVFLGVDVGGTGMKGVLVDAAGDRLLERTAPTPVSAGPDAVVTAIRSFCVGLATEQSVDGAGVVVPGIVDADAGIARYAANIGWKDVPIAALVADDLHVPVRVDHDVRTAGVAEGQLGAARGHDDYLFVPVGTGIAASIVQDGRAMAGPTGAAGELGHIPIYPDGERCACGQRGCLETYASAAAIARRYVAAGGTGGLDARQIVERLGQDRIAEGIWGEACTALGIGLATYTLLNDPTVIVLGGGLAAAGETLLKPVRRELSARLAWRPAPPIVVGQLGSWAGAIGAALLGRATRT